MQNNEEEDLHEDAAGFVAAEREEGAEDRDDVEPPVEAPPLVPPPPLVGQDDDDADDDHGLDNDDDDEFEDDEFELEDEDEMEANIIDDSDDDDDDEILRPALRYGDDGRTYQYLRVIGFRQAASLLASAAADQRPIDNLEVVATGRRGRAMEAAALLFGDDAVNDDHNDEAAAAASFARFVTVLGQQEGGRTVKNIELSTVRWANLPNEAMERLFRTVLPGHRTLRGIQLDLNDDLPMRFVQMLTESISATREPMMTLYVGSVEELDPEKRAEFLDAIVAMLRRNAAVDRFAINFALNAEECQRIAQCLTNNTNLTSVHLIVHGATAESLHGFATAPSLQRLYVLGSFAEGAVAKFTRQLRTNVTLQNLQLVASGHSDAHHSQALLDFVKTYNYTLDEVRASDVEDPLMREQFHSYRARNRRIRSALDDLPSSDAVLTHQGRLAPLLGMVSDVPTVLQRFVKRYYPNVVSERLLMESMMRNQGQGRRDNEC